MSALRTSWQVIKTSVQNFSIHEAVILAAAIAFYAALSLAPLVVLMIVVVGLFTSVDAQQQIVEQAREVMGEQGATVIQSVIANASEPRTGSIAAIISVIMLLIGASGVFAQLQVALNRVWDVTAKSGSGWKSYLKKRAWSLLMVLAVGLILLITIILSAVLSAVARYAGDFFPGAQWAWQVLDTLISLLAFILLFGAVYKLLPDVELQWSDVWIGATVTAILFALGKVAIGLYLGFSSTGSSYGAAGSFVALLVYVYYSAIILLLGAEITRAITTQRGTQPRVAPHARPRRIRDEGDPGAPPKTAHPA